MKNLNKDDLELLHSLTTQELLESKAIEKFTKGEIGYKPLHYRTKPVGRLNYTFCVYVSGSPWSSEPNILIDLVVDRCNIEARFHTFNSPLIEGFIKGESAAIKQIMEEAKIYFEERFKNENQ